MADPSHRRMVEVLDATPALLAYERQLHEASIDRLALAFVEASHPSRGDTAGSPPTVLASVTASMWMAAVRSIVMELRSPPPAPDDGRIGQLVALTEHVLAELQAALR